MAASEAIDVLDHVEFTPFQPDATEHEAYKAAGASIALRWHGDTDPNADRAWLVRNLVFETGCGLLGGQWGAGKTFGALDLSASVMTGEPFAGRRVMRQGGVLFVAPEGAFEIPIRLRGVVEGKLKAADLSRRSAGNEPLPLDRLPIAWIEECPPLIRPGAALALGAAAQEAAAEMLRRFKLPLALIIIDTIAAAAGFDDENSAAEAQKALNAMAALSRMTGAFVLGVDHFGKATETGIRGSTAKPAAADVVLAMLANRSEAGEISNTRMAVHKVRGARCGYEIPYVLEVVKIGEADDGEDITTCFVEWEGGATSSTAARVVKERWPAGLKIFRQALATALDVHGTRAWPFGKENAEQRAVPMERVRAAFYGTYPALAADDSKRADAKCQAFGRAIKTALERSLIGSVELQGVDHLWLIPE